MLRETVPLTDAQRDGWLAPDGRFYPCHPMSHLYLEKELLAALWPEENVYDYEEFLQEKGWCKFQDHTPQFWHFPKLSPAQVKTLADWVDTSKFATFTFNSEEDLTRDGFFEQLRLH